MGDLAIPPPAERAATLALAQEIVRAVENNDPGPEHIEDAIRLLRIWRSPDVSERLDVEIFRLAQDLVDTRRALELACESLDTEGLEETAHRLRSLDLEVR